MMHELKTHPEPFDDIAKKGIKFFEYRKNDRDFKVGDSLWLRKYNPDYQAYMKESITVWVTHILYGPNFGIPEGYCIMSINY